MECREAAREGGLCVEEAARLGSQVDARDRPPGGDDFSRRGADFFFVEDIRDALDRRIPAQESAVHLPDDGVEMLREWRLVGPNRKVVVRDQEAAILLEGAALDTLSIIAEFDN